VCLVYVSPIWLTCFAVPPSVYGMVKMHKARVMKKLQKERDDMLLQAGVDPAAEPDVPSESLGAPPPDGV
jgi:hypothetical protein